MIKLDDLVEAKKNTIGQKFTVNRNELGNFVDGKCTLIYQEKEDVKWSIDVQLLSKQVMMVTDIRRDSIIKVC